MGPLKPFLFLTAIIPFSYAASRGDRIVKFPAVKVINDV